MATNGYEDGTGAEWQLACSRLSERGAQVLQSAQWSDCVLAVGRERREVRAHRLPLAMASPVLARMLYIEWSPERSEPVPVPDVEPDVFHSMLQYIYTERVEIASHSAARELYYAAQRFALPHLVAACSAHLAATLSPANVCAALEVLGDDERLDAPLREQCLQLMRSDTAQVLGDSGFLSARPRTVETLFALEPLAIRSEMELFQAAERYVAHRTSTLIRAGGAAEVEVEAELEVKEALRGALQKIRFLTLEAPEFVEHDASSLLSAPEQLAILNNIVSANSHTPMPSGFSRSRTPRHMTRQQLEREPAERQRAEHKRLREEAERKRKAEPEKQQCQEAADEEQQIPANQQSQSHAQSARIITPQDTIVTQNMQQQQQMSEHTIVQTNQNNGPIPQQNTLTVMQQRASTLQQFQQAKKVVVQSNNASDMGDLEESITAAILQKHPVNNTMSQPQQFHTTPSAKRQSHANPVAQHQQMNFKRQRMSLADYKRLHQPTRTQAHRQQPRELSLQKLVRSKKQQRPVQRVPPMQSQQVPQQGMESNEGIGGPSEQTSEDSQSAKMLMFLPNGEQRLITFTLPKERCTLQQFLEQVNVPFTAETRIQCLQSTNSEIDYFVSVGSTTRLEEMLENHPMLVGDISSRSSPSVMSLRLRNRKILTMIGFSRPSGELSEDTRWYCAVGHVRMLRGDSAEEGEGEERTFDKTFSRRDESMNWSQFMSWDALRALAVASGGDVTDQLILEVELAADPWETY